jgi:uncharacterized membrane protein
VLCCFNSKFTKKINKITNKTDKNTIFFVILLVLFVILLIFCVCFCVKTTEHTVGSYESSNFPRTFLTVYRYSHLELDISFMSSLPILKFRPISIGRKFRKFSEVPTCAAYIFKPCYGANF